MTKTAFRNCIGLFALSGAVVADWTTKLAAHAPLPAGTADADAAAAWRAGPAALVRVENAGSALGFSQHLAIWLVVAAAGAVGALLTARLVGSSITHHACVGLL